MDKNVEHFLFLVYIMFRDLRERILDLLLSKKLKTIKPLLKCLTDEENALVLLCYICTDVSPSAIL